MLRRFLRDRSGNVAMMLGLCLLPLAGMAGFAIDYSVAESARGHLQDATDAAALAGVKQIAEADEAISTARRYMAGNIENVSGPPPTYDATVSQDVLTVTASQDVPTKVSAIIGIPSIQVRTSSAARQTNGSAAPVSVHALAPSVNKAFEASGGSNINAPPCVVWVNSTSVSSVNFSGGSNSTAARHCFEGGISQGRFTPSPEVCGARADPFEGMNPAVPAACTYNNFSRGGGTYTLQPGVYCGGLTLSGGPNVTLSPGLYVVRNGALKMSGGGVMRGDGVTILVEGAAGSITLSGGGSYYLTGPTSGELAGFVIFHRPNANVGGKAVISGSGDMYFEGILYFPGQKAEVSGGGSTQTRISPWTAYIARTFLYSGSSTIRVNYDPARVTVPIPGAMFSGGGRPVLVS